MSVRPRPATPRPAPARIGFLAPMEMELEPLVAELMLRRQDNGFWSGLFDGIELVALPTDIGMAAARSATARILAHGVSVVAVVGIAGGVDPAVVAIGDVIRPASVQDRAGGTVHVPTPTDAGKRSGVLSCGDDLITDAATLSALGAAGVIALDMETAAVAAVCEAHNVPWTAFRAISDHAGGGLVSDDLMSMTGPDGNATPDAVRAFLSADADRRTVLERLARDAVRAAETAAGAAVGALDALARIARATHAAQD